MSFMTNNEVFKKMLHLTGCGRNKVLVLQLFALGGQPNVTNSLVRGWRADQGSSRGSDMPDWALRAFFDGLFFYRDSQSEQGVEVFCFPRDPDE